MVEVVGGWQRRLDMSRWDTGGDAILKIELSLKTFLYARFCKSFNSRKDRLEIKNIRIFQLTVSNSCLAARDDAIAAATSKSPYNFRGETGDGTLEEIRWRQFLKFLKILYISRRKKMLQKELAGNLLNFHFWVVLTLRSLGAKLENRWYPITKADIFQAMTRKIHQNSIIFAETYLNILGNDLFAL